MDSKEEQEVLLYLNNLSSIDKFYLHRFENTGRALIHYFDEQGESWALMEDDDTFVSKCMEYLCKQRVPEFTNVEELKKFESEYVSSVRD